MKRLLIGIMAVLLVLPLGTSAVTQADQTTLSLASGDNIRIECNGVLRVENQSNTGLDVYCDAVVTSTIEPTQTTQPSITPTSTSTATATVIPTPEQETPVPSSEGIWLSQVEVNALPMTGSAWENVKSKANSSWGSANIGDNNSTHDVYTLAGALYAARTNDSTMKTKVANAIISAIGTETNGRTLEASRNIVSYVIAADIINLKQFDSAKDQTFRTWLAQVRHKVLDGRTIITTHEDRPNNWGTHAGATRVAIARYLNDQVDLNKAAIVFKGWLGDRNAYSGFDYGDLDWQSDPNNPVGINPLGATINGHNVDGVLPDDQRRGGGFTWPAFKENYAWEALQGATVQAQLLARAGYDVWNWEDKAMLRAVTWLYTINDYPAEGDDTYIPWIINKAYGSSFTTISPVAIGKNMSFTDWSHK